ncbi:MAG: N-acetylmuramoyl-L-alanine amidase, partial [Niameybacter sp.]
RVKVKHTREIDKYLSLSERTKLANAAKADYFISIHCNSFEKPSANGTETFIYTSVDNNTIDFANHVHQELVDATGLRDRGIKSANFAVLRETSMPAILVELAFISNPEEEELLTNDEWLDKVAEGIVKGILKHVGKVDDKVFNVTKKAFKIAEHKADIIETHDLTGKGVVKRDNPTAMINLALYDMDTHTNFMYLENENVRHPNGYKGSKYGIGVKVDGTIIPCTWDEACKSTEIKDFASASPTLMYGGKKCIDWGTLESAYLANKSHYRMIVGFKGPDVFLCMCNEQMSIEECYKYCASEGFTDAFVYDGNGSQFMYADSKIIKDSVRENVTWLQLFKKVQNKPV